MSMEGEAPADPADARITFSQSQHRARLADG